MLCLPPFHNTIFDLACRPCHCHCHCHHAAVLSSSSSPFALLYCSHQLHIVAGSSTTSLLGSFRSLCREKQHCRIGLWCGEEKKVQKQRRASLYMGRRPDRSLGPSVCYGRVVVVIFLTCIALLVVMVATTSGAGVSLGPARAGSRVMTKSSQAQNFGGGQAGEDAYQSSKRRIPKGPDPIHNRRAGKMTIAPRRRD